MLHFQRFDASIKKTPTTFWVMPRQVGLRDGCSPNQAGDKKKIKKVRRCKADELSVLWLLLHGSENVHIFKIDK